MSDCNCTLRERLVGDGCPTCNPELAKEIVDYELEELKADPSRMDHEREDGQAWGGPRL